MTVASKELVELLQETRALLAYQERLGLEGLNLRSDVFSGRPRPSASPELVSSAPQALDHSQRAAEVARALEQTPRAPAAGTPVSKGGVDATKLSPELRLIRDDLGDCTRCKLCAGRTNIVFGVGNPKARLMFVGEGPGRDEDLLGEPFVGAAGQLLDKMIVAMGLRRSDVYIANIVKCRPPKNRDPEPDEIVACEPFLVRQIEAVKPEVIVALGRIAAQTLLRDQTPISRLRGAWREYQHTPLLPTFHPAYLLRNPADKKLVWADLQEVMRRLGMPLPKR